jgi:ABC-type cobalamin/Fe3+-siderophores transport system ATPase subunit
LRPVADPPVLEVRGLRAERGGRVVLDGVDLRVEAGGVTALVGDSGSGKTSLLRCIVGLDAVAAGDVLYDGAGIGSLNPCELRRRVALVAQSPVMLPGDVRANLLYAQPGADAPAALASVGLDTALLEREAEELSGGERARVAIARALAHEPRVVLLDEPTASLHAEAVAEVEGMVRSLASGGIAVVVVTHDRAQARRLADSELRLERGRAVPAP